MANIRLSFRGEEYVIPDKDAFAAGEAVEEIVTLAEIAQWGKKPKFRKLARCFGELLRFAGCKVSDAEVFTEIMGQVKRYDGNEDVVAVQALNALVEILMDGAPEGDEGESSGKNPAS